MFFPVIFLVAIGLISGIVLVNAGKKRNNTTYAMGKDGKPVKVKNNPMTVGILLIIASSCLCLGFIGSSCIASVDTGHTGIIKTFGKVEDYTLDSGLHFKAPWQELVQMDNRVQKSNVELSTFSMDLQEVTCSYTVNYQISKTNAQEIYRTIGEDYYNKIVVPNISESVKTMTARYNAEQLVGKRDELAEKIETMLRETLVKYNIEVVGTSIEDLDFKDEFTAAVEAKQVAAQNKLKAATEQEQKTLEAEAAAEREKIDANAKAEVAKIQAEADLAVQKIDADAAEYAGQKEAAKNRAINESLTGELLKYYLIQRWDGKYPDTYMGTDNVSTIVDISSVVSSSGN